VLALLPGEAHGTERGMKTQHQIWGQQYPGAKLNGVKRLHQGPKVAVAVLLEQRMIDKVVMQRKEERPRLGGQTKGVGRARRFDERISLAGCRRLELHVHSRL